MGDIENGNAIVATSHGSLMCYFQFQHNSNMTDWLSNSFKKVVCKVNNKELNKAREECEFVIITESGLDNREVGIALLLQREYGEYFKFFKLWK